MDDNRFQMTCGNIELGILSKLGPCPGNPGHTFRPSCFWSCPVELSGPGMHGPKPFGPGPSGSVVILGLNRTKTNKI